MTRPEELGGMSLGRRRNKTLPKSYQELGGDLLHGSIAEVHINHPSTRKVGIEYSFVDNLYIPGLLSLTRTKL